MNDFGDVNPEENGMNADSTFIGVNLKKPSVYKINPMVCKINKPVKPKIQISTEYVKETNSATGFVIILVSFIVFIGILIAGVLLFDVDAQLENKKAVNHATQVCDDCQKEVSFHQGQLVKMRLTGQNAMVLKDVKFKPNMPFDNTNYKYLSVRFQNGNVGLVSYFEIEH